LVKKSVITSHLLFSSAIAAGYDVTQTKSKCLGRWRDITVRTVRS